MQVQLPLDALRLRQLNVAVVLVMVVGWNGVAGGVVGGYPCPALFTFKNTYHICSRERRETPVQLRLSFCCAVSGLEPSRLE